MALLTGAPDSMWMRFRYRMCDHRPGWWFSCGWKKDLITYRFLFSRTHRCSHRNRFGWRCWRYWTYDHWCGLHNTICWHHFTSNYHQKKRPSEENHT